MSCESKHGVASRSVSTLGRDVALYLNICRYALFYLSFCVVRSSIYSYIASSIVTDAATVQGLVAQGSAAAQRDALKYRGNNGQHHPGHAFIPASVEIYGYLGKPLARYLNTLSEVAASQGPAVTKGSLLAGAHRELSVALIKCHGSVYRGCANLMAKAAGRQVSPGAEIPSGLTQATCWSR